jgi:hypothetical protein
MLQMAADDWMFSVAIYGLQWESISKRWIFHHLMRYGRDMPIGSLRKIFPIVSLTIQPIMMHINFLGNARATIMDIPIDY